MAAARHAAFEVGAIIIGAADDAPLLAVWVGSFCHQPDCGQRHRFHRHYPLSASRHFRLAGQSARHAFIRHIDYADGPTVFIADAGRLGKAGAVLNVDRH